MTTGFSTELDGGSGGGAMPLPYTSFPTFGQPAHPTSDGSPDPGVQVLPEIEVKESGGGLFDFTPRMKQTEVRVGAAMPSWAWLALLGVALLIFTRGSGRRMSW